MHVRSLVVLLVLGLFLAPLTVHAASPQALARKSAPKLPSCTLPESNAEGLVLLADIYPGYWWDHTDLTIAIQAHPSTTDAQRAALRGAIATWSAVLFECFDGLITLTDVTASGENPQKAADIVVHFVPHAGGALFAGLAICGAHDCPNILVRSENPPAWGPGAYHPQIIEWIALHEIGHALGLGHTTNLEASIDVMGYGWPSLGAPILSDCDIDAIAFIFAWALDGSDPHPPATGPYDCSLD